MNAAFNVFPGTDFESDGTNPTAVVAGQPSTVAGTDDAIAINAALSAALTAGGGMVILQRGSYRIKTRIDFPGNKLRLVGQGPGATVLLYDDSAGLTDGIRMLNRYLCSVEDLTISASATRTAGVAISIQGGDATVVWNSVASAFHQIKNVEMLNQCSGLEILDGTGAVPCWGVWLASCMNRWEFANGGTGILVNTTGGLQYLNDTMLTKKDGATVHLYEIRIRASKDAKLAGLSCTLGTDGLRIDPPSGSEVTAIDIRDCRFDTITGIGLNIIPAAGSTCRQITFHDCWIGNCVGGVSIGGTCSAITVHDNEIYVSTGSPAVKIGTSAGPTKVSVVDNMLGGNNIGVHCTNSVQGFKVVGNTATIEYGQTLSVGVQVDAGCDRYTVTDNDLVSATTPLTVTPVDSANRRISTGNITL